MRNVTRYVPVPALPRREFLALFGSTALVACGGGVPVSDDPSGNAPAWLLEDVQPASDRYGESYGLDSFRGSAVLVALLAGGCNTCRGIAGALDPLLEEWRAEGMSIAFCAVNEATDPNPQLLSELCSYPVFQDTLDVNAWERHGGGRDDLFVYGASGALIEYFPFNGTPSGNPLTDEGKANLKDALTRGL